jgi:thiol-disulfide isomerase/thioredoxin
MKLLIASLLVFALMLQGAAPVPRKAADLTVVEASGKQTKLSSLKGKVVVVQFLFTWCPHCQETAQWLSRMQSELGPQGLAVLGVAFDEDFGTQDKAKSSAAVAKFAQTYARFPVGVSNRDDVLSYLGISVMERIGVPMLMVVDRNGVVQAQSKPMPTGELEREPALRSLVTKLLANGSGGVRQTK